MPVRVLISYSHDTPEHSERVYQLSETLRLHGVDVDIDQYHQSPREGWPRWMTGRLQWASYVLVVCSARYRLRFEGIEDDGTGKGVKWEGAIITQELYEAETQNTKFIPILLADEPRESIPIVLRGTTHYRITEDDTSDLEGLYRHLTNQPLAVKASLGELKRLSPRTRAAIPFLQDVETEDDGGIDVRRPEDPGVSVRLGTLQVELHIDAEFESFDEEKQQQVLRAIGLLIDASDDIRVIRKRKGSVVLTVELTPDKAERLKWAVARGDLSSLGVFDAIIKEHSEPPDKPVSDLGIAAEHAYPYADPLTVDPIQQPYDLPQLESPEAAEILSIIEIILEGCLRRNRPIEIDRTKGRLFEMFRRAENGEFLSPSATDCLSANLIVRRLADRWDLRSFVLQAVANQRQLPVDVLSRLRVLWSFSRVWTEWAYASRKPKAGED